ncbi:MAG: hypothetical protein WA294_21960 [Acidobacteriaceae bacterium]
MVNNCANPKCGKPLHYLRDGRVFIFDVPGKIAANGKRARRIEHFWLCGTCSQTLAMKQSSDGIQVVVRPGNRLRPEMTMMGSAVAS